MSTSGFVFPDDPRELRKLFEWRHVVVNEGEVGVHTLLKPDVSRVGFFVILPPKVALRISPYPCPEGEHAIILDYALAPYHHFSYRDWGLMLGEEWYYYSVGGGNTFVVIELFYRPWKYVMRQEE